MGASEGSVALMNTPVGKPLGGSSITNSYAAYLKSTVNGTNSQEVSISNSNDQSSPFTHIQWINLSSSDFTISIGSAQQGTLVCPANSAFLIPMRANSFAVNFTALSQYVNALRTDDK